MIAQWLRPGLSLILVSLLNASTVFAAVDVCVDPGHGFTEGADCRPGSYCCEAEMNLNVSQALSFLLAFGAVSYS